MRRPLYPHYGNKADPEEVCAPTGEDWVFVVRHAFFIERAFTLIELLVVVAFIRF